MTTIVSSSSSANELEGGWRSDVNTAAYCVTAFEFPLIESFLHLNKFKETSFHTAAHIAHN